MKCLDDCHTYKLDTVIGEIPGLYEFLGEHPEDILPLLHFYEMRLDGTKIDGVTNEEILRVLIHRLKFLNDEWMDGKFKCPENDYALFCLTSALNALEYRTKDRIVRNVKGTHEV